MRENTLHEANGAHQRRAPLLVAALVGALLAGPAAAQAPNAAPGSTFLDTTRLASNAMRAPGGGPVLTLSASARSQVANDEMLVTLAVERDGALLAELNAAVVAQLDAALAEAKRVEGVRARLGSIQTIPQFDRNGNRTTGWRVRGEVQLESRDLKALPALAGRLAERMQLSGVAFRLSETRRRQEESRLLADAARAFGERATDAARAFGFSGYAIRELALGDANVPVPRPMFRARAEMAPMGAAAAMPLPAEGGDSEVVVSVTGTVELRP